MKEENKILTEQFLRIFELMGRFRHQMDRGREYHGNPHRGQGRVLSLLKMNPEISQKDLAFLLDVRPQSLGEILTKLEKSGYITRTQSEEDKRVMKIRLTESGEEMAEHAKNMQESSSNMFEYLTDEEQTTLSEMLSKVICELEKETDYEGKYEGGFRGMFGGRESHMGPFNAYDRGQMRNHFGRDFHHKGGDQND